LPEPFEFVDHMTKLVPSLAYENVVPELWLIWPVQAAPLAKPVVVTSAVAG
jgi:hypothetical protein